MESRGRVEVAVVEQLQFSLDSRFFAAGSPVNPAPKNQIQSEFDREIVLSHWQSRGLRRGKTTGGVSKQFCPLEPTPIRMAAEDAIAKTYCMLAIDGGFHQAIRKLERLPQVHSPTFFRIRKTPLIADRVVGHAPGNSSPPMASRAISTPEPFAKTQPLQPWFVTGQGQRAFLTAVLWLGMYTQRAKQSARSSQSAD